MHFVSVHVLHPYSNIDTATAWKKSHFIKYLPIITKIIINQYIYIYIYIYTMILMVRKIGYLPIVGEFSSHWVLNGSGFVLDSAKVSKWLP